MAVAYTRDLYVRDVYGELTCECNIIAAQCEDGISYREVRNTFRDIYTHCPVPGKGGFLEFMRTHGVVDGDGGMAQKRPRVRKVQRNTKMVAALGVFFTSKTFPSAPVLLVTWVGALFVRKVWATNAVYSNAKITCIKKRL